MSSLDAILDAAYQRHYIFPDNTLVVYFNTFYTVTNLTKHNGTVFYSESERDINPYWFNDYISKKLTLPFGKVRPFINALPDAFAIVPSMHKEVKYTFRRKGLTAMMNGSQDCFRYLRRYSGSLMDSKGRYLFDRNAPGERFTFNFETLEVHCVTGTVQCANTLDFCWLAEHFCYLSSDVLTNYIRRKAWRL